MDGVQNLKVLAKCPFRKWLALLSLLVNIILDFCCILNLKIPDTVRSR